MSFVERISSRARRTGVWRRRLRQRAGMSPEAIARANA
jgi:hypothetical protein